MSTTRESSTSSEFYPGYFLQFAVAVPFVVYFYFSSVLLIEHHFTPLVAKCCLFYLECCGFEKIFFTVKFLQSTFTKASLGVDKSQPQSVKEFHAEVCNTSSANFQVPTELPIQQSTALFIYLW